MWTRKLLTGLKSYFSAPKNKWLIDTQSRSMPPSTKNYQTYWNLYTSDALVSSVINSITFKILGKGFTFTCQSPGDSQHIMDALRGILTLDILTHLVRDVLIFGDSYAEIIRNRAGNIIQLVPRQPINFKFEGSRLLFKGRPIKRSTVLHLRLFPDSDCTNGITLESGISLIKFAYQAIQAKRQIYQTLLQSINEHGTKKWHVIVKPDSFGRYPDEATLAAMTAAFKNFNAKKDVVSTDKIDIKGLDPSGIPQIEKYQDFLLSEIASGFLVPPELLGIMTANPRAISQLRINSYNIILSSFQKAIASQINDQFIRQFVSDVSVQLVFQDITSRDERENVEWVIPLVESGVISIDEARHIFGFGVTAKADSEAEPDIESKSATESQPPLNPKSAYESFANSFESVFEQVKPDLEKMCREAGLK